MTLSILIPVYNYDITKLVREISDQVMGLDLNYEIRVYEDGSTLFLKNNRSINKYNHCIYRELPNNIGRSAIRNLLAREARFKNLLFLDADVMPCNADFIRTYMSHLKATDSIISGGLRYQDALPQPHQVLRWKYGHERESLSLEKRLREPYRSFLSSNFAITKSTFGKLSFNEKIPNLACEDTLFAYEAKSKKIPIHPIENPVFHLGLETGAIFFKKSLESVRVRKYLIKTRVLSRSDTKITRIGYQIEKIGLRRVLLFFHTVTKKIFETNILSKNPSLFIFDLYRLGYYCSIKGKTP